jgi:hypothetical protein
LHGVGPDRSVREIALGEATDFVGGGFHPGGGVGAGAELFVFEVDPDCWIDGNKDSMAVTTYAAMSAVATPPVGGGR